MKCASSLRESGGDLHDPCDVEISSKSLSSKRLSLAINVDQPRARYTQSDGRGEGRAKGRMFKRVRYRGLLTCYITEVKAVFRDCQLQRSRANCNERVSQALATDFSRAVVTRESEELARMHVGIAVRLRGTSPYFRRSSRGPFRIFQSVPPFANGVQRRIAPLNSSNSLFILER